MRINENINETLPRKSGGIYYLIAVGGAFIVFFILVALGKGGRFLLGLIIDYYYIALVLLGIYLIIKLRDRKKRKRLNESRYYPV